MTSAPQALAFSIGCGKTALKTRFSIIARTSSNPPLQASGFLHIRLQRQPRAEAAHECFLIGMSWLVSQLGTQPR